MQKLTLILIFVSIALVSCASSQPVPTDTPVPSLSYTSTPIIYTPTPTITSIPTYTPTLTQTVTPTSTISVPKSAKNKQYWAIVESNRAAFWFMLPNERIEWEWFKAPFSRIEYEWSVEFLVPKYPYSYVAGADLAKSNESQHSKKGSIVELLGDCETGVWEKDWRGVMLKLDKENMVTVIYHNGGVLIEINDPAILSSLIQAHPKTIFFRTRSYSNNIPNRVVDVAVIYQ